MLSWWMPPWGNDPLTKCFSALLFRSCLILPLLFVFLSLLLLLSPSSSQLDGLLTDRESLPERSKEIRERLRGKGLPSGKMSRFDTCTHTTCREARKVCAWCIVYKIFLRVYKQSCTYTMNLSWLPKVDKDKGVWFLSVIRTFCYSLCNRKKAGTWTNQRILLVD